MRNDVSFNLTQRRRNSTVKENKTVRTLSVLIFAIGVFCGMMLSASIVWGDLEAARFDAAVRFDKPLTTLECPVMVTKSGTVSASFTNPLDRAVEFRIRTHISQGSATLMREENSRLPLEPGETQSLEWTVTADDAAYGRLILVRVFLFGKYPLSSRDGSCGILVVNVSGFTGNQLFSLILAATLLSMAVGAGLWVVVNPRPLRGREQAVIRSMAALAASVLLVIIVGMFGNWMFSVLVFVITVLLIGTIIGHFVTRTDTEYN